MQEELKQHHIPVKVYRADERKGMAGHPPA
jgi:hypothetical protein